MFKKLFLGGRLAWPIVTLLILGLALSVTPGFAQGTASGPIIGKPDTANLALVTSFAPLLSFPPQLKINGTLPSPCYSLNVLTLTSQATGNSKVTVPAPTISIIVQMVRKAGAVCTQVVKPFSTTVTLDPRAMKLKPGSYQVLINPLNGKTSFKTTLVVH